MEKRTLLGLFLVLSTGASVTAADWKPVDGQQLRDYLLKAAPGDTITLAAGKTYVGPFQLPYKSGANWITIVSGSTAGLPDPGTRVDPGHSSSMPQLKPSGTAPVVTTAPGAHHYRFVGIEITTGIEIINNLFLDVDHTKWGGNSTSAAGRLFHILNGTAGVTIEQNTAFQSRAISFSTGRDLNTNFVFKNNVTRHAECGSSNNCGIAGDRTNPGNPTLARYFSNPLITGNVMWDGNESGKYTYPAGNLFPAQVTFGPSGMLTNPNVGAGANTALIYAETDGVEEGLPKGVIK